MREDTKQKAKSLGSHDVNSPTFENARKKETQQQRPATAYPHHQSRKYRRRSRFLLAMLWTTTPSIPRKLLPEKVTKGVGCTRFEVGSRSEAAGKGVCKKKKPSGHMYIKRYQTTAYANLFS